MLHAPMSEADAAKAEASAAAAGAKQSGAAAQDGLGGGDANADPGLGSLQPSIDGYVKAALAVVETMQQSPLDAGRIGGKRTANDAALKALEQATAKHIKSLDKN